MNANPPIILIDTCVWLDNYLLDRAGRKTTQDFMQYALDHDVPLAFASHSALDVYAKTGADIKSFFRQNGELSEGQANVARAYAWDCAAHMRKMATPIPADTTDFFLAEKYRPLHTDMEDNLILAACSRAKANYLVTRDRALLRHADIAAKTPEEMLALLESGLAHGNEAEEPAHDSAYYLRRWLAKSTEQAGTGA